MKRKAIVTGGAGFIGSHLSNLLNENNYDVTVFDDLSNGSGRKNLSKEIKVVKGSILNVEKIKSVCKKSDVIFNLAVKPLTMSFDKPEEVVKVNDYGTYLVAKICTEYNSKLIHVSSSEAYGTAISIPMKERHPLFPHTIYAGSKAASEVYVRGFEKTEGLKMVIIRPFNSYGEYMRTDLYAAVIPKFFERVMKKRPLLISGTGEQTRDFTYVKDTCNGIMLADQTENAIGDTFNIGQGKEASINEIGKKVIEEYNQISGKNLKGKITYTKQRKGDVMRHLADISHARKILGYKPEISLKEGVRRYISWANEKNK